MWGAVVTAPTRCECRNPKCHDTGDGYRQCIADAVRTYLGHDYCEPCYKTRHARDVETINAQRAAIERGLGWRKDGAK